MILAALALVTPCPVSDRWTVVERGATGPWVYYEVPSIVTLGVRNGRPTAQGEAADEATFRAFAVKVAKQHSPTPITVLRGYGVDCAALQHIAAIWEDLTHCTRKLCFVTFNPPRSHRKR
jgi:hypothetical protein